MADLMAKLSEAEALVERIKRDIANGPCRQYGHTWKQIGGCNAGCDSRDCQCSVPVNECTKCGDCDYGQNADATEIRIKCSTERGMP